MLHRALIAGIVAFWAVMTGLLLRVELFPDPGNVLSVPVSHVVKLLFLHQQPSSLVLYYQQQRLGSVHVQATRARSPDAPPQPVDLLGIDGALVFALPGLTRGRATFNLSLELDDGQELRRFEGTVLLPNAWEKDAGISCKFEGRPPRDDYHYLLRRGPAVLKEKTGRLAALLSDPDFGFLPIDPRPALARIESTFTASPSPGQPRVTVRARRGQLNMNGEELETFVVSLRSAEGLECTAQVSQLGQILSVKTFAGISLLDDTIAP